MKQSSLIIIAALVLVAGGVGAYALKNSAAEKAKSSSMEESALAQDTSVSDEMMPKQEPNTVDSSDVMMKKENSYIPFSPEILANTTSTRRVLFFYANWCPTCKPANADFTENAAQLPTDVTVIRVNYNDTETDQAEKDLAKKYGITYQHTFVQINADGNEVTKWNGGQMEELLRNLE